MLWTFGLLLRALSSNYDFPIRFEAPEYYEEIFPINGTHFKTIISLEVPLTDTLRTMLNSGVEVKAFYADSLEVLVTRGKKNIIEYESN